MRKLALGNFQLEKYISFDFQLHSYMLRRITWVDTIQGLVFDPILTVILNALQMRSESVRLIFKDGFIV